MLFNAVNGNGPRRSQFCALHLQTGAASGGAIPLFVTRVVGCSMSSPVFPASGSLLAAPPSLVRVLASPVPRRHQYYEGAARNACLAFRVRSLHAAPCIK